MADPVATGDCVAALARVTPDDATEAERLAAGWCALRQEAPTQALDWLGEVRGPLAGYAAWQRAEALRALGRIDDARKALADASVAPDLRDALAVTRVALAEPRLDAVAPALDGASVAVRLAAAQRVLAGERPDDARALLVQVWEDGSPGGHDAVAAEHLAALGHAVPDLASDEGIASAKRRVRSLQRAYRHPEALALLDALSGGAAPSTRAERLAAARARSKARDHEGALALWAEVVGPPEEAVGTASELFDHALTHARTGDYETAAVGYQRLIAQHPGSTQADFGSYKLGYMAWDAGDCPAAVAAFDAHLARYPKTRHRDETLWFRSRCHWVSGDRDAARTDLQRLVKESPTSSLVPGAAYWLAVDAGGESTEEGREGLRKVLQRWPTHGYAWFAAERLGHRFEARPEAEPPPLSTLGEGEAVQRASALLDVGLDPWARAELATLSASSRAHKLALAWAWLEAGAPDRAKALACPLAPSPWKDGDPVAAQACTPRPEHRLVSAVASAHGLEPSLPYGVMVAESALKPEVTSPAGARGLMQLMPEVGATLHPTLFPHRPYDPDDLYNAPYNAALGTAELGQRARSLAGVLQTTDLPAVVASYNAGEQAVRRWLEPYDEPPPFDAWAEAISYTETRRYVKRVLGHAMAVRWVYGDADPGSPK